MSIKKWDEKTVFTILKKNRGKSFSELKQELPGVIQWCAGHGGIRHWEQKAGFYVRREFTEEYVLKILKENAGEVSTWFRSNEPNIVTWCENNGGWENWKIRAGIKDKIKWDEELILDVLTKNKEKEFKWFQEHYSDVVRFCVTSGGWREWAKKAGVTTASKKRNEETVLNDLGNYKTHTHLTYTYLIENEPSLVRWCYRNGGLKYWVAQAGLEICK